MSVPRVTVVFNVFKSEANLPYLLEKLAQFASDNFSVVELEIVFVIDGSPDQSETYLRNALTERKFFFKTQIVVLSRNFGGPNALRCGFKAGTGEYFASMACDLQEPLSFILDALKIITTGQYDIVYGQRTARDDSWGTKLFAAIFWSMYRRILEKAIPKGGADLFLCTRPFRDAVIALTERNQFLIGLMFWIGFRRAFVPYARAKRTIGKSSWSLSKRIQYMMDSIFSFSDLPIKAITLAGMFGLFVSIGLGTALIAAKILGFYSVPGYTAIMLAICFFFALNCFAIGIVGEYVWRVFLNVQKRPHFIVREHLTFKAMERPKNTSQDQRIPVYQTNIVDSCEG